MSECPPWLVDDGQALLQRVQQKRLPHAILIAGHHGIGKQAFANWLAQWLLCRQHSAMRACGHCESCRQFKAQAHPDYRRLQPEGASAAIKVEPVRELVAWLQLTAGYDSYRVALVEQADTMNRHAANCLLKTLEEPGENTLIILTATRSGALPATVRSRCQRINLKLHDRKAALAWLADKVEHPRAALDDAGGGPYAALTMQNEASQRSRTLLLKAWRDLFLHRGSVGRISDSLSALDTRLCLATFSRWSMLACKQQAQLTVSAHPEVQDLIRETHRCLSYEQWFAFYENVLRLHRMDSASFKTQTVLEGMFADTRLMTND